MQERFLLVIGKGHRPYVVSRESANVYGPEVPGHEHVKVAFIQLDANYEDAYIPSKAAAERLSYTSRTWKHTLNISEEDKALYELSTMYTLT